MNSQDKKNSDNLNFKSKQQQKGLTLTVRKLLECLYFIHLKVCLFSNQNLGPGFRLDPTSHAPLEAATQNALKQPHETPATNLARLTAQNTLNQAHSTSFGYFIAQDSQFGNLILPVIPRFD